MQSRRVFVGACMVLLLTLQVWAQGPAVEVRVGHFPNITHSQALVGRANGWFEKAMGNDIRVEWKTFNAGPSAIEALFAGAIDLTYIGPNPAITGYIRSEGEALRIIAGASSGGAALVVRGDSGIEKPEDFRGRKIASPQLGNTQDVGLRHWLTTNKLALREKGGDVQVIPIANADQLTLFIRRELDAAWAPEPWASRLIHEANGRLFLDERSLWPEGRFVSAHLIVRTEFLRQHRAVVRKWIQAHVELTEWINSNFAQAKQLANEEIKKQTGKALSTRVLDDAFSRLQVTYDPVRSSLLTSATWAYEAGFLGRRPPDLSALYDLSLLNEVLKQKGARPIP